MTCLPPSRVCVCAWCAASRRVADAAARRTHSAPMRPHALSASQCVPARSPVRAGRCRGASATPLLCVVSHCSQGLSLHTHALLKFQCLHTAAVLWAAHSSHALCDMLCERARATEGIASLRLGLEDALSQAAVALRIPPITHLCPGNRSVLLGIAPLLWPLIMYSCSPPPVCLLPALIPLQTNPQNGLRPAGAGVLRSRRVHR